MRIFLCVQVDVPQNLPALKKHPHVLTSYFDIPKKRDPWDKMRKCGFRMGKETVK